jgi:threonine dehydrogenase-like Zn-dependent dehydrogenase
MKALVYQGPWDISVETRPDPVPGPADVTIRVIAVGICGSDIHGFTGDTGRRSPGQVMGHEMSGVIESVGSEVNPASGLEPGAAVTVNPVIGCGVCDRCTAGEEQTCPNRRLIGVDATLVSAFAESIAVPAKNVVLLSQSAPIEFGALVEPLAVGFHAARRGGCSSTDSVLVIGGGPIGQACVLAAQRLGATRIAVSEPNGARRSLVASLGAVALDPAEGPLSEQVQRELGGPVTVVLDAVGVSATVKDALQCSALGARIVLVGMGSPNLELPAYLVSTEERSLIGSFCYSKDDFRATAEWAEEAGEVLERLIEGRVDLEGAPSAFTQLARGESEASKILVFPQGVPAGSPRGA